MKNIVKRFVLLSFLISLIPRAAYSFGYEGHKIVVKISSRYLTPAAKQHIGEILGDASDSTLAEASVWADLIKRNPKYDWARPLHYVNIPANSNGYKKSRDCFDNGCVVEAIRRYAGVLKDSTASRKEKQEALKFLIHFVGDIHQPLHAGLARDRGGNDVRVYFFGEPTNLHRVWDYQMIERKKLPWPQYADSLQKAITEEDLQKWNSLDPVVWVNESFHLAHSHSYNIPGNHRIGEEYYEKNIIIVEQQLKNAGVRLALLLNDLFRNTSER